MNDVVAITKQELEEAVASLAVKGVMTRVFHEIELLDQAEINSSWFTSMMNVFTFCSTAEVGFGHAKSYTLAIVHKHWNDVPLEIRKSFGFSFKLFAQAVVPGKQWSTIDNYIRTARVWFIDKATPFGKVEVVERQPDGKPIMNGSKPKTKWIDFNPYKVDMSKLMVLNAKAAKGEMTPRLWQMLADDFYTNEDILSEKHRQEGVLEDGEEADLSLRFYFVGPALFASEDGEEVCVAESLNWEEADTNPLVKRAIQHIMFMLHVPDDEFIIAREQHLAYANHSLIRS